MMMRSDPVVLPRFHVPERVLEISDCAYNPTGEVIFPTVVDMAKYLDNPIDRYYMYYAPHGPPADICLATAPSLTGPWTEHGGNPLIPRNWPPHYTVSHVSTPHVLWIEEESCFFCFFHGENTTTRYASSPDGITWTYEGVSISTDDLPPSESIGYTRVYRYDSGEDYRYVQILVQYHPTRHGIHIARSRDARSWTIDPEPIITPRDVPDSRYTWTTCLVEWQGQPFLVFHADHTGPNHEHGDGMVTHLYAAAVDPGLMRAERPCRLVDQETFNGMPEARVSDPFILEEEGKLYLFAAAGGCPTIRIVCAEGEGGL
ncbi:MAG: hypothetical protein ACYTGH_12780 [Planctomycetota bacterium]|jgi:hypothetical protein